MAYDGPRTVTSASPELLTTEDASSIFVQNRGQVPVFMVGTVGANPPSSHEDGILVQPGETVLNETLEDLFPGVAGANRVYGITTGGTTDLKVSYA